MVNLVIILGASIFGAAGINYILNTIAIKRRRVNFEDYKESKDPIILEEFNNTDIKPVVDTEESIETKETEAT